MKETFQGSCGRQNHCWFLWPGLSQVLQNCVSAHRVQASVKQLLSRCPGVHENPQREEAILLKGHFSVFQSYLCVDFWSLSNFESKQGIYLFVKVDDFRWRENSCGGRFWKHSEIACLHINVYGSRKTEEEKHSRKLHDSQAECLLNKAFLRASQEMLHVRRRQSSWGSETMLQKQSLQKTQPPKIGAPKSHRGKLFCSFWGLREHSSQRRVRIQEAVPHSSWGWGSGSAQLLVGPLCRGRTVAQRRASCWLRDVPVIEPGQLMIIQFNFRSWVLDLGMFAN